MAAGEPVGIGVIMGAGDTDGIGDTVVSFGLSMGTGNIDGIGATVAAETGEAVSASSDVGIGVTVSRCQ